MGFVLTLIAVALAANSAPAYGGILRKPYYRALRSQDSTTTRYTPIEYTFKNQLPNCRQHYIEYNLNEAKIPTYASGVLVYLWETTYRKHPQGRLYFKIATYDGIREYPQYMNAAVTWSYSLNSANVWLPLYPGIRNITVTLYDAKKQSPEESVSEGQCQETDWDITRSELSVLGYQ